VTSIEHGPGGFGWKKDPYDARDRMHMGRPGLVRTEGRRMDLLIEHVRHQGGSSSCVGHAIVAALELLYAILGRPITRLSPKHAYWVARAIDGFQHEDGGAFIRSGLRGGKGVGFCPESMLPLDVETINERPPEDAENAGITFADFKYERVLSGAEGVLDALQSGHPVVMGVNVTNVFAYPSGDEVIPAPTRNEVRIGGHAFLLCGFDRHGERIRMLNSWGRGWADGGFAWLDPAWIDDPSSQDVIALIATGPNAEAA
jgi:hypothetical protein